MSANSQAHDHRHGPKHIAIIMDGNGRWARRRGLPRLAGHRAGVENIRRIMRQCVEEHVEYLTLYAFSTENWNRPRYEVEGLMSLLGEFIDREMKNLHEEGVQIRHLGRPEGLSPQLRQKIDYALNLTQHNTRLVCGVALNYGGRAEIVDAVKMILEQGIPNDQIDEACIARFLTTATMPDPDIIIRTSGEMRLSNFLIWQAAYAEFYASPVLWPDFGTDHLRQAIHEFRQRERRFGGLIQEG
jgi:undecaprenyl diphosphate synthase